MKTRNKKEILEMVAAIAAVICIVILLFFRTGIFTSAISKLVSILTPFIYGFVIAYLLRPIALFFEKKFKKWIDKNNTGRAKTALRLISVLLSIVLMFAVIVLFFLAVVPGVISSINSLISQIPDALKQLNEWLHSMDNGGTSHEVIVTIEEAVNTFTENITGFLKGDLLPHLQTLVSSVTSSFMGLVAFLKDFGLGCIISIYMMASWEKLAAQLKLVTYAVFPKKAADWIRDEVRFIDRMFNGFIHGKLLDSLIIGIICFIFCTITRMPYTMLVSVIIGVTNMIPFFGPYIGAIPSTLLVLTVSPGMAIMFLIFIIILQQFDGNLIGPKILGDQLGLSSFCILFAILFFGALWGVIGMLIGAPLFAVIYDLVRRFVVGRLKNKGESSMADKYFETYHADDKK